MIKIGNYTSTEDVSAYLGEALSADTTPTEAQVNTFITRAEAEVDEMTGTSWTSQTRTADLYDYDEYSVFVKSPQSRQVGRVDNFFAPVRNYFKLNYYPIISVTSLEVNKGSVQSANWITLTEGTDFIKYSDEGVITFISSEALPVENYQGIRITYTYGHSVVTEPIKRLATLLTVREVMRTKQTEATFVSADSISIETISISKSTRENVELMNSLQKEIDELIDKVVGRINNWIV